MRRWGMRLPTDRTGGGGRQRTAGCRAAELVTPGRGQGFVRQVMILACLALGVAALGGCSHAGDCSSSFYGGCVPLKAEPVTESPAAESPVAISPAAARPTAVNPGVAAISAAPVVVSRGDPGAFADVDDRQCRSYGLTFGSHDYADCRIRLSAQHRGLDPNLGTAATGTGSR
jgi:hypothetical protein